MGPTFGCTRWRLKIMCKTPERCQPVCTSTLLTIQLRNFFRTLFRKPWISNRLLGKCNKLCKCAHCEHKACTRFCLHKTRWSIAHLAKFQPIMLFEFVYQPTRGAFLRFLVLSFLNWKLVWWQSLDLLTASRCCPLTATTSRWRYTILKFSRCRTTKKFYLNCKNCWNKTQILDLIQGNSIL